MSIRTPLAHVRGLGSAHEGAHHWWMQRLTAIALIPLTMWFIYSIVAMTPATFWDLLRWFASPYNTAAMALMTVALFYHALLGMQVIIEDYVHHRGWQLGWIILTKFVFLAAAVASLVAIMKLHLAG